MMQTLIQQVKVLLEINLLVKLRSKSFLFQVFMIPVCSMVLIAVLKLGIVTNAGDANLFTPVYSLNETIGRYSQALTNKTILVSPETLEVRKIVSTLDAILQQMRIFPTALRFEFHANSSSMEEAFLHDSKNISIGLIFDFQGGSNYTYTIRSPYDDIPDTRSWQEDCICEFAKNIFNTSCFGNQYIYSGFSLFQIAIDTAILRMVTGDSSFPVPRVYFQMMPKPSYTSLSNMFQLIVVFGFVITYSALTSFLTHDLGKENTKKIRNTMKIMGLQDSAFWFSCGLTYFILVSSLTMLVTIVLISLSFFAISNIIIVFIILMLYGLPIITMSCVMSFINGIHEEEESGLVMLLSCIIYWIINFKKIVSPGVRWFLCLIPPVAAILALDQVFVLDKYVSEGMDLSAVFAGEFPLYAPMLMMIIDFIICLFLTFFLSNVIPGSNGAKRRPWCFLKPSYWCLKKDDICQPLYHNVFGENIVEPVTSEIADKLSVSIQDIYKEFSSDGSDKVVPAVDGLCLDIYKDQITVLLGHNGAGKTTLVNMMTGLIRPTKGTAYVFDLDISDEKDMKKIRTKTGICPQHNTLFDNLSCKEHLNLFAGIKGVPKHKVQSEIETVLKDVGLYKEKDSISSNLTGGQKRKLSVAIALIGDPNIIFLDEPTAGMDPYSRRQIWTLLQKKKEGRVIVMTTHFMDEADILADRIAIISKGKLRCCGSSLFLKSKFGLGYHLNMVVDPACDIDTLTEIVNEWVPGGKCQKYHGEELVYTLPPEEVSRFAGLFFALDKKPSSSNITTAESLGIMTYGISMTSLEEVFLKLEEDDSSLYKQSMESTDISHTSNDDAIGTIKTAMDAASVSEKDLKSQQFRAFIKIQSKKITRRPMVLATTVVIPVMILLGMLIFDICLMALSDDSTPVALFLQKAITKYARSSNGSTGIPPLVVIDSVASTESTSFFNEISADFVTEEIGYTSELLAITPHHMGLRLTEYSINSSKVDQGYTVLYNDSAIHSLPAVINLMTNRLLKTMNISSVLSVASLPWPKISTVRPYIETLFLLTILTASLLYLTIISVIAVEMANDRELKIQSQMKVSGVTLWMYLISTFSSDSLRNCIPVGVIIFGDLILQLLNRTLIGAYVCTLLLTIVYLPSILMFGYVVSFHAKTHRICVLAGCLLGLAPCMTVMLTDLLRPDVALYLHYCFAVAAPPYAIYGGHYYIDRKNRISTCDPRVHSVDLPFADYFSGEIVVAIVMPLVHCVLAYCYIRGSTGTGCDTCLRSSSKQITSKMIPLQSENSINDEDQDVTQERQRVAKMKSNDTHVVAFIKNLRKEFVKKSKTKLPFSSAFIHFLRKVFVQGKKPPTKGHIKVAVQNSTFAVESGEIFGLLGPNGSGKSTTLNMMTTETKQTKGQVAIGGYDIQSSAREESFKTIGYCPQHDALWNYITVKEHIEFYAKIRGVQKSEIPAVVDTYIGVMKLDEHKNKIVRKLSGGTKRKLSFILSILGKQKMLLLDEPSTGMDPQSKRILWNTISGSIIGHRGAILTTHDMEEADALCSRVAIMVDGKIQCLGSPQHLKDKYGNSYLLEAKLKHTSDSEELSTRMEAVKENILSLFPEANCLENSAERVLYKVPKECVRSLGHIFSNLQKAKTTYSIEYSFSQTTLEQVFLQFTRQQMDKDNEEDA